MSLNKDGVIVILSSPSGAGKTTLIKEFCKELGCNNPVTSPTFPILNIYNVDKKKIYHADLYRINTFNEFKVLLEFYKKVRLKLKELKLWPMKENTIM